MSYDDQQVLTDFGEKQGIPYPLLSDIDSEVIRRYGILNTQVDPDDAMLWGIPYPGVFVTDENGVVVAKFFHDTYKKRDSPEILIDAALGRVELSDDAIRADAGDEEVRLTVAIQGGKGSIRQGIIRHLVARFELAPGLHVYGEPVPEGMIPVTIDVQGPPGLVVLDPILPPTETLRLPSLDVELQVWSGVVDIAVPFYATGELASETRPLDAPDATLEVKVRYQACNDEVCLLPRNENLTLELPMDVIDIPDIALHRGHGQRAGNYDGTPHLRRLMLRKVKQRPLGLPKFFWKSLKLELQARARRRAAKKSGSPG